MKSLAVRVLGEFAVDGVEPLALGSRKARQALALLALGERRAVPADVIADALWGDAPPAKPEEQVSVLMSRLRSVLGRDRIEHRDGGYLLRYDWLDAAELAALVGEMDRRRQAGNLVGAAAAARVALSLVRGSDEGSRPAPVPGEWAQLRRSELDRLVGRARQASAAVLLDAGDWMTAVDAATAALDHDPYSEAALRVLLRGYVTGGQVAAALAAYSAACERLADDLGTDPSPETVALHTAILRGELAAPSPMAAAASMGAVGRDGELAALDAVAARARGGSVEIAVVDGEAGIGKTTLLKAWAARRASAGEAVLLASCSQLDRAMPLDALLAALAAMLRRLGAETGAGVLGADAAILAPLLGSAPTPNQLPMLGASVLGPAALYSALARVLGRLAAQRPLVVAIDDAHLAGRVLHDWVRYVQREELAVIIVATVRTGEGDGLPATARLHLTALGRDAAAEIVGAARVDELYARSKGHPLFLTELAQSSGGELPASLVESVSARCDELGTAGTLLRAAAVIGPELDFDLLAAVLGRPVVDLLGEVEQAVAKQFLAEEDGTFRFRHELVMQALAASASAGRAALLHRQAGRVLSRRLAADPAIVAGHARLGGDVELASRALRDAAARAAERFDHAAAEALLDDALSLHADPEGWLARARVRTRRGHYAAALRDVERASAAGAAALEVGAWASYFGRDFAQAAQFAADGALAAEHHAMRARCLAVGGRTRHAAGDLAAAESAFSEALSLVKGADRVTAAAWLGVLRSHQSRIDDAFSLLRPAARGQVGAEHTAATLHALLFTGHSLALAGDPARALEAFSRYTAEVERRQVPRFAARAVNFAGWVLRNLGATSEALDHHQQALEVAREIGSAETMIAALEDLAEHRLDAGDPDGAEARLAEAAALLAGPGRPGDLVFGWRLELKHQLISARLALARGRHEQALAGAGRLADRADLLGVPRYSSAARLLRHRASRALGQPVDLDLVAVDLDAADAAVAIEAWRLTAAVAAELGSPALLDRAADRVRRLAASAGDYADALRAAATRELTPR